MDPIFYAYPSQPEHIGQVIESAVEEINKTGQKILSWTAMDTVGSIIPQSIVSNIEGRVFAADVTRLNFNVMYELGYAIGSGSSIILTRNNSITDGSPTALEVGIVDTLGVFEYENAVDLASKLRKQKPNIPLKTSQLNSSAPVYLLESSRKTDFLARITARVRKAGLQYRSFDPSESPRLSALDATNQVAQSHGVIVSLLSEDSQNHLIHNIRAAFIAGLAKGMGKIDLILQHGNSPVPIDLRDFAEICHHTNDVDPYIGKFALSIVESFQQADDTHRNFPSTVLEKIDLGQSAAENEMRTLNKYYLKTDAFNKALKGDAQLVVGRKGSGKSAIFLQIRENQKSKYDTIVLDLKPEGYQLIKFKEQVLDSFETGTFQHTIMAFWEYILLLEICHKILETDRLKRFHSEEQYQQFQELDRLYSAGNYLTEGDFSERLTGLMNNVKKNFKNLYSGAEKINLSSSQITELVYKHDLSKLRDKLTIYLSVKKRVWILFDNIDKGWPPSGLQPEDLTLIRALIDAAVKIQRHFEKHKLEVMPVVFLRNDVYEHLVIETSDRQKESKVVLDWTDQDLLREIVKLRLISNQGIANTDFNSIWRRFCVSHYLGEDSFQYILDRSLMRPRFLLNLINHCRSIAVNLNHTKIQEDDIKKGLEAYSADLLAEINLEIRDIFPEGEIYFMDL